MAQVQILYVATASGLVQLASPGTSNRWRPVGDALSGQDVLSVRASATEPLHAFAGAAMGLHATFDGGASWVLQRPDVVTALAAAPDGAIYAGTDRGAILLGGLAEWVEVHSCPAAIVHLSVLAGGRIAAVFKNGMVELLVDGQWAISQMLVPCTSEVVCSFARPDDLFITNETSLVTRTGARTVQGKPTGALVLLPGKPEVLLFGTKDYIQRSDDAGATLHSVEGPSDVRVLVAPPHFQDFAYAGTGGGELWFSRDRGRSWQKLHEGMAPVRDLSFARIL